MKASSFQPDFPIFQIPRSIPLARISFARRFRTMASPETDLIKVLTFDFGAARLIFFLKQL